MTDAPAPQKIKRGGKGKFAPKTGGRVKGSINKLHRNAKEAIEAAAQKLGGAERLYAWAKEDPANERLFWGSIYPKLLPHVVTGQLTIDPLKVRD
jgi:hypothetical protein